MRHSRVVMVLALSAAILMIALPIESAADKGPTYGNPPGQPPTATTIVVQTGTPGQPVSQPSGGGGVGPVCWVDAAFDPDTDAIALGLYTPLLQQPNLAIGVQHCVNPDGTETRNVILYDTTAPPPPPDAQTLANQVRAELPLRLDPPSTAPPARSITGLPTWVWVDAAQFRAVTATRTAGPLSVTVTATPTSLTIDPGDGHTEHCSGAGVPWHEGADAGDPGACTHVYTQTSAGQPGGAFTLTATASWRISWTATNGQSGALPPVALANQSRLVVQQVQPVLDP